MAAARHELLNIVLHPAPQRPTEVFCERWRGKDDVSAICKFPRLDVSFTLCFLHFGLEFFKRARTVLQSSDGSYAIDYLDNHCHRDRFMILAPNHLPPLNPSPPSHPSCAAGGGRFQICSKIHMLYMQSELKRTTTNA